MESLGSDAIGDRRQPLDLGHVFERAGGQVPVARRLRRRVRLICFGVVLFRVAEQRSDAVGDGAAELGEERARRGLTIVLVVSRPTTAVSFGRSLLFTRPLTCSRVVRT